MPKPVVLTAVLVPYFDLALPGSTVASPFTPIFCFLLNGLGCLVVAVAIASLVLNVLVFVRFLDDYPGKDKSNPPKLLIVPERPTIHKRNVQLPAKSRIISLASIHANSSKYCPSYGEALNTPAWKAAATNLQNAIDEDVNPCDDFYKFSCGKYISHTQEGVSTLHQAQLNVNKEIVKILKNVDVNDENKWFGAIPFLNHTIDRPYDFFETAGSLLQLRALGTLTASWPVLPMPREYYVQPQYMAYLEVRGKLIKRMLTEFAKLILDDPSKYNDMIDEASNDIVSFERQIAMASWPDSELRDYGKQYNRINLDKLMSRYPTLKWESYFYELLSTARSGPMRAETNVVISQPSYFAWLSSLIATKEKKRMSTIVNYMITQLLFEIIKSLDWMSASSKAKALRKGYIWIFFSERHSNDVVKLLSVELMPTYIGWPLAFGDFKNTTAIDDYHRKDYAPILEIFKKDPTDFYNVKHTLQRAFINREHVRPFVHRANRMNFLMSPALVDAWYQLERNVLVVPCALWSPPFYNKDYPMAVNFAGLGSVVGRELVHAFDDEGIQFDGFGGLICEEWKHCSWADDKTKKAYVDAAQCVVSQYSSQCCPVKEGFTRCVDGAATQGQNIADLGGRCRTSCCYPIRLQAAYTGYLKYMQDRNETEKRLPGLEQYTPKQLFWMSYANTWCSNEGNIARLFQLIANQHAPAACRTNQVVQDIPEFAADFGCQAGEKMFPSPDARCKVWA
ncbi:unnamed protein product [Haemonchus placei]|uniref:Peptidase_M13 domain-containing protein n=1 Tax=Haemonchus placei TaxID=6290 RepID=A0A0N4WR39_HAEPC|nr:unnamed protein product [Haemonchus placei]